MNKISERHWIDKMRYYICWNYFIYWNYIHIVYIKYLDLKYFLSSRAYKLRTVTFTRQIFSLLEVRATCFARAAIAGSLIDHPVPRNPASSGVKPVQIERPFSPSRVPFRILVKTVGRAAYGRSSRRARKRIHRHRWIEPPGRQSSGVRSAIEQRCGTRRGRWADVYSSNIVRACSVGRRAYFSKTPNRLSPCCGGTTKMAAWRRSRGPRILAARIDRARSNLAFGCRARPWRECPSVEVDVDTCEPLETDAAVFGNVPGGCSSPAITLLPIY